MIKTLLACVFCIFSFFAEAQTAEVAPATGATKPPQQQQLPKKMSLRKDSQTRNHTSPDASDYTTDTIFISKAGQFGVTGQVLYVSGYIDSDNKITTTLEGFLTRVGAQYGVDTYLNLYLLQNYTNTTSTTSGSSDSVYVTKGIGDTYFGVKGSLEITSNFLVSYDAYYGAGLLAKAESDFSKSNDYSSTAVTGRPAFIANVTFVALIDNLSLGSTVEGELDQEGSYNSITASGSRTITRSSGTGSNFHFFAQYDLGAKIGAAFTLSNSDPYDSTNNGTVTRNAGSKYNAFRVYGFLPLGSVEIGAGLTKPTFTNTPTPVTSNIYFTDAFVRARF